MVVVGEGKNSLDDRHVFGRVEFGTSNGFKALNVVGAGAASGILLSESFTVH